MSIIITWLIIIIAIMYWILNKFVKFMTAGHLKLKDLIRAGLWSMIGIFIWKKLHPNEDIPDRFNSEINKYKELLAQTQKNHDKN